jgi:Leucine-rich repeat (LRR) protein
MLSLAGNKQTSFAHYWSRELKSLDLSGCHLKAFPAEIAQLSSLTYLCVENNQITDLSAISQLFNLEILNIASNQLIDVANLVKCLSKLPHLLSLDTRFYQ